MIHLVYKSTDLLDSILFVDGAAEASCHYVRLTDGQLASPLFNRLLRLASSRGVFFPRLLCLLPGFRALKAVRGGDVVVLFDMTHLLLIDYLRRCMPAGTVVCVFFWNPLERLFPHPAEAVGLLHRWGCRLSTFDQSDANHYDMELKNQFIRVYDLPAPQAPQYDFYYLGAAKGREELLHRLVTQLASLGLHGLTIVVQQRSQFISYHANLFNIGRSHCIIELVQPGQTGITLRALEALVYRRKLITNCTAIATLPFYHPDNILVWDTSTTAHMLRDFLSRPLAAVPDDILRLYTFTSWISSFQP